jgi:hypothetical protein
VFWLRSAQKAQSWRLNTPKGQRSLSSDKKLYGRGKYQAAEQQLEATLATAGTHLPQAMNTFDPAFTSVTMQRKSRDGSTAWPSLDDVLHALLQCMLHGTPWLPGLAVPAAIQ